MVEMASPTLGFVNEAWRGTGEFTQPRTTFLIYMFVHIWDLYRLTLVDAYHGWVDSDFNVPLPCPAD